MLGSSSESSAVAVAVAVAAVVAAVVARAGCGAGAASGSWSGVVSLVVPSGFMAMEERMRSTSTCSWLMLLARAWTLSSFFACWSTTFLYVVDWVIWSRYLATTSA